MGNEELTDREHEELRLLYQVSVQDLAFFKNQQWRTSHYGLLLHAAIVLINYQLLPSNTGVAPKILLTAAPALVLGVAWWFLRRLRQAVQVRRARLEACRGSFTKKFESAWKAMEKGADDASAVFGVLLGIQIVGAVVTFWLVATELWSCT
ncbi:MAG: hypothetical protein OEY97_11075 [Nitrospirota bacterium]|nr:hypothetical protein [Nitrospirota bacterium]